jgi:hypothetical protein
MAEIYIRIIKTRLYRYFNDFKTNKWINVVDKIASNLNNSYHSVLGIAPSKVTDENASEVWYRIYRKYIELKQDTPQFKEGDLLRLSSEKHIFAKGYVGSYTTELSYFLQSQRS